MIFHLLFSAGFFFSSFVLVFFTLIECAHALLVGACPAGDSCVFLFAKIFQGACCFSTQEKKEKSERRLLTLDGAAEKTCCPCFLSPHPASPHVRGCPRPHVTQAARASNPSSRAERSASGVPPTTTFPHRACPRRRTRRHSAFHRACTTVGRGVTRPAGRALFLFSRVVPCELRSF